jgi:hypothetical protein
MEHKPMNRRKNRLNPSVTLLEGRSLLSVTIPTNDLGDQVYTLGADLASQYHDPNAVQQLTHAQNVLQSQLAFQQSHTLPNAAHQAEKVSDLQDQIAEIYVAIYDLQNPGSPLTPSSNSGGGIPVG